MLVKINYNETNGKIKPMHAINNGPVYKPTADQRISNMADYTSLHIPYARNHDASFCSTYGGEHTVDVNFIFPNFDADPYDESSYDFACTDEYIKVTELAGTETFYRLGSKIEHGVKKYNTLPPKDFKKWAIICEHIIKHYNYGWANGFHYDLKYWEIWNEPNLVPEGAPNQATWGGTRLEFYELYCIAATHLKEKFPELKIGGPAYAGYEGEWADGFFERLNRDEKRVPLDFFSWHLYCKDPKEIGEGIEYIEKKLNKYGFTDTEHIVNEWNYVSEWSGEGFINSVKTIASSKGAVFTAAMMCLGQQSAVDMLMYYDARPCAYNGLWAPYTYDRLKTYYSFAAFDVLYQLGDNVPFETSEKNGELYMSAAKNGAEEALMIVNYSDDEGSAYELELDFSGIADGKTVKYYLLDEEHDLELISQKKYDPANAERITIEHNSMLLVRFS